MGPDRGVKSRNTLALQGVKGLGPQRQGSGVISSFYLLIKVAPEGNLQHPIGGAAMQPAATYR